MGWHLITKTVCENPVAKGNDEKVQFAVYDYMDKYMVCISQSFFSKEAYGKITVTDSLNSDFISLNYKSGSLYDTDYWYICLDTLPEDYTIYINGEPTFKPLKTSLTDKIKDILNR